VQVFNAQPVLNDLGERDLFGGMALLDTTPASPQPKPWKIPASGGWDWKHPMAGWSSGATGSLAGYYAGAFPLAVWWGRRFGMLEVQLKVATWGSKKPLDEAECREEAALPFSFSQGVANR
jgi:hypothetical protein